MQLALSDWFGLVSTIIAIGGVGWGFYSWRNSELRHADIHAWALEAIATLQSLNLTMACVQEGKRHADDDERILDAFYRTSVLIEQGRLYFRNFHHKNGPLKDFGKNKPTAYRGIRPRILDCLIVAHEAAAQWKSANQAHMSELRAAVSHAEREFVSLSQKEVGRNRTACEETREPGTGSPLDVFLKSYRNGQQTRQGRG